MIASCDRLSVDDAGNTPATAAFGPVPYHPNSIIALLACSDLLISPTARRLAYQCCGTSRMSPHVLRRESENVLFA